MEPVRAFAVGTPVEVGFGDDWVRALVTAVQIRSGGRVSYELVWWSGTERSCEWVEGCEVRAGTDTRWQVIGFAGGADAGGR